LWQNCGSYPQRGNAEKPGGKIVGPFLTGAIITQGNGSGLKDMGNRRDTVVKRL